MSNANATGRPHEMYGPWAELVDKVGSVTALAHALHTNPRAIQRWARGVTVPSEIVRQAVNQFARMHGCAEPFNLSSSRR